MFIENGYLYNQHIIIVGDPIQNEDPREFKNSPSVFWTWLNRYRSPDKLQYGDAEPLQAVAMHLLSEMYPQPYEQPFKDGDEKSLRAFIKEQAYVVPVYAYIHGAIAYKPYLLSGYDSGFAGYIFMRKAETDLSEEQAIEIMRQEVFDYSSWANGEYDFYSPNIIDCNGDNITPDWQECYHSEDDAMTAAKEYIDSLAGVDKND